MASATFAASTHEEETAVLVTKLLNVKVAQLHVKWLKEAMQHIHKENPGDLVYKICCCYRVFSHAASQYKEIPYALEIARYYANEIIDIIETNTGENIRELADRINGREGSIPTNMLFWCDAIELKKEQTYHDVWVFIHSAIENTVPFVLNHPEKQYDFSL
jgi:hypothetical protein